MAEPQIGSYLQRIDRQAAAQGHHLERWRIVDGVWWSWCSHCCREVQVSLDGNTMRGLVVTESCRGAEAE